MLFRDSITVLMHLYSTFAFHIRHHKYWLYINLAGVYLYIQNFQSGVLITFTMLTKLCCFIHWCIAAIVGHVTVLYTIKGKYIHTVDWRIYVQYVQIGDLNTVAKDVLL